MESLLAGCPGVGFKRQPHRNLRNTAPSQRLAPARSRPPGAAAASPPPAAPAGCCCPFGASLSWSRSPARATPSDAESEHHTAGGVEGTSKAQPLAPPARAGPPRVGHTGTHLEVLYRRRLHHLSGSAVQCSATLCSTEDPPHAAFKFMPTVSSCVAMFLHTLGRGTCRAKEHHCPALVPGRGS